MGNKFEKDVPEEGDLVRVTNVEENEIVAEGEVLEVQRYKPGVEDGGDEEDNAVYFRVPIEPDNILMFKYGYWDGKEYSWARCTNYGGPEVKLGENCYDYEVL